MSDMYECPLVHHRIKYVQSQQTTQNHFIVNLLQSSLPSFSPFLGPDASLGGRQPAPSLGCILFNPDRRWGT